MRVLSYASTQLYNLGNKLSNHSSDTFDVAIVGAGPAGSSAAIRLAMHGARVLLLEEKKFPRAKLCGEFISPECISHFQQLGVLDQMLSAGATSLRETVFYSALGYKVAVPSEWFTSGATALGLSRSEMDHRLLERAAHYYLRRRVEPPVIPWCRIPVWLGDLQVIARKT